MLVSLKIRPLAIHSDCVQLLFSVGESAGSWTYRLDDLLSADLRQQSFTVLLSEPLPPMPSPKRIKRASMKQEARVAEDMGGHRQRGSGAVPWRKSDGIVKGKYRIENKTRFLKSITIARKDLDKIRSECDPGETPLFQVNFTNRTTCMVEDQWILVPYEHWKKVAGETTNDRRPNSTG